MKNVLILVSSTFSIFSLAAVVDSLRSCNRVMAKTVYKWNIGILPGRKENEKNKQHLSLASIYDVDNRNIFSTKFYDIVFMISESKPDEGEILAIRSFTRHLHAKGVIIGAVDAGCFIAAEAGILDGRKCAIHPDYVVTFRDQFPLVKVVSAPFEVDREIYTSTGGLGTLQMMVYLIRSQIGEHASREIYDQVIMSEAMRPGEERQAHDVSKPTYKNSKLDRIIEKIKQHSEAHLKVNDLALQCNISRRQMERIFLKFLHVSPAKYCSNVRLDRARYLLMYTSTTVASIAAKSGFKSVSNFCKCYRARYGHSPGYERKQQRDFNLTS